MKPLGILALPVHENSLLPALHFLLWRRIDSTIAGHCLDFDLYSFSSSANDEEAASEIMDDLVTLSAYHIASHAQQGTLHKIYGNRYPLHIRGEDSWEAHHDSMHRIEEGVIAKAASSFIQIKNSGETPSPRTDSYLESLKGLTDQELSITMLAVLQSFHQCYRFRSH